MADFKKEQICRSLDEKAMKNSIVCMRTTDVLEKQLALNYMIEKGWICVQNDSSATANWTSFSLTFATKEAAASFKV